jgi:hypothetical protein
LEDPERRITPLGNDPGIGSFSHVFFFAGKLLIDSQITKPFSNQIRGPFLLYFSVHISTNPHLSLFLVLHYIAIMSKDLKNNIQIQDDDSDIDDLLDGKVPKIA